MRCRLIAVGVLASIVLGCGDGDDSQQTEGPDRGASQALPQGCRPSEVRNLFGEFFDAVNDGDRQSVLRYISPQGELRGIAYTELEGGRPSGETTVARTPAAAYRLFAALGKEGDLSLIAAQIGAPGPTGPERLDPKGADKPSGVGTAGSDHVFAAGSRFGAGKNGIDCEAGRFYLWSMSIADRVPVPRGQTLCGEPVDRGSAESRGARPVVCRY